MSIELEVKTKKWYTIKVQNNHEKKVSERLKHEMMREYNIELNVLVPIQNVLVLKNGTKVQKEQLLYSGYIFVETTSPEKIESLIKNINGATNLLKDANKRPLPLRQIDVDRMVGQKERQDDLILNSLFIVGENVVVVNGPFQNFKGVVDTIDIEKNKVKVAVKIFGRLNMVDLTLDDIVKDNE